MDVVGCRWNVKMAANWGFSSRRWLTVSSLVATRLELGVGVGRFRKRSLISEGRTGRKRKQNNLLQWILDEEENTI